jgi:hypothetical protein
VDDEAVDIGIFPKWVYSRKLALRHGSRDLPSLGKEQKVGRN